MTVMFLTMWEYTRDVEEDYRRFRPDKLPPEAAQGAGYYVQPYADNPLDEEAVGRRSTSTLSTRPSAMCTP